MSSDEQSLRMLEGLMTEFFDVQTSNSRKKKIEEILSGFSQTEGSWQHCLYYATHTKNDYVVMYCLKVIETVITNQWLGYNSTDKLTIRNWLNSYLLSHHDKTPYFIRNKLAKLVVDIGRMDWPQFYPEFFTNMVELTHNPDTISLGITLLLTASQELATPRDGMSMCRQNELKQLMLLQVPTVLDLLNNILETNLEKHRHLVAATPPPSPTHSTTDDTTHIYSSSPLQTDDILDSMLKQTSPRAGLEATPPLDDRSKHVCELCLECLAHYFSWIPLSSTITTSLLSTIFQYTAFGSESRRANHDSFANNTESLGVIAMACINELLEKNCVPQHFNHFMLRMFQQTFFILQQLTKETSTTENRLAELDDAYVGKFTEFLHLFVSNHLGRFEHDPQFPVMELLALLFKYTFRQPSFEGFFRCIDVWNTFLDYLHTKLESRGVHQDSTQRYREVLSSLVHQTLHKCLFRYNETQLEELDDTVLESDVSLDDAGETEWQHFLAQCIEVIAKVAELSTPETFSILYTPFQECLTMYLDMEKLVKVERGLSLTSHNDCRKLHCNLRDLSSLLRILGRLSIYFIGEHFVSTFHDALLFVQKLVYTITYGTTTRLYDVSCNSDHRLKTDITDVYVQCLASMKACCHWLAQFYTEAQTQAQNKEMCDRIIAELVYAIVPLFNKQIPEPITHAAAHLLVSLTHTVRPANLTHLSPVSDLYRSLDRDHLSHFTPQVQILLFRSLSHHLLLPWPGVLDSNQDWTSRGRSLDRYVARVISQFLQLKHSHEIASDESLQRKAKPVIKWTLDLLIDLITSVSDQPQQTKMMCLHATEDVIHITLALFPVYIRHADETTDAILQFFLSLLRSLRVQMGVALTEHVVQTFMKFLSGEQIDQAVLVNNPIGRKVMESFLRLCEVLVQEQEASFRTFLPQIIDITMNHIYPILAENSCPDVKSTLYTVLYELLMNNWRYFYKSYILMGETGGSIEHRDQFIAIMQAFGQSFLQPDVTLFRHNLNLLENLNKKLKLYDNEMFRGMMRLQFLNVFIQVLSHKSHDLLKDEITLAVYNLATIDFGHFYSTFLSQFLAVCENIDANQKAILIQNFQIDTDLPTFHDSLQRFVNDLRYYQLTNTNSPAPQAFS